MSWRKVLSVPVVLILLLAGMSLMAAGAHETGLSSPGAHRLNKTREALLAQGGPDPFGYTYADSNEPDGATFDWLNISSGTALSIDDNEAVDVPLPFTFTFYGFDFWSVAIHNEGALFLGVPPLSIDPDNESLSTTSLTEFIAPFWDNFAAGTGAVYYDTLGTSPHRRFVVEWHDRQHDSLEDTSATVTFEVILYEGTNNVKLQYQDTDFGDDSLDDGASATVGIRQSDSNYLQYSYNQAVLDSGMAICFQYPDSPPCDLPPQIDVSPTHISATQLAGEVTTHTLSISNSGDLDLAFALTELPPVLRTTERSAGVDSVPSGWIPAGEAQGTVVASPASSSTGRAQEQVNLGMASSMDADLLWISAVPASGTVPGGSGLQVTVTFTAPQEVHDTYAGTLRLSSSDPLNPLIDLPLTMTVVLPPRLSITKHPSAERVDVGSLLTYTLSVSNTGGPVGEVTVSDTLPSETVLAWTGNGGTHVGSELVWSELHLLQNAGYALSYAVTVTCVPSGTQIVNQDYQIEAADWPPPIAGQPVTVTAVAEGIVAAFDTPALILCREPVPFTNLSQGATTYLWHFGDGLSSSIDNPVHTYMERGTYTAELTASSRCSADEYSRVLSVEDLALVMTPDLATGQAAPGQTAIYALSLTNTGTLSDSFALTLSGGQWSVALPTKIIGPLAPGSRSAFQVLVSVPRDAVPGQFDQVTLQAVSSADPRRPPASAATQLTTTVLPYRRYLPLVFR
jgi:uncharacterized repeat protein (TIGR01451 family)